ncbi:MAG: hypothetical protein AAF690_07405 [Acidobacteriota bacterium]
MQLTDPTQLFRSLAAGAALGALLATPTFASETETPRTASGKPDLTGYYNIATLTPMSRPPQFGENKTLTPEEAQAITDRWTKNLAKDFEASDPDREAPPEGGVEIYVPEFQGASGGVGGYNAFYVDIGDSTFQLDGEYRTSILVDPPNGRFPALSEQGRASMKERAKFMRANTGTAWWMDMEVGPYDDPELRPAAERCLLGFGSTAGPPTLPVMYNNLKRIVQTDDHLMILNEMNHDARIIRIADEEHDPELLRKWLGDSIARWDGDELVITTKHFRDELPFSQGTRDMVVEERISRIDEEALLYRFTVSDPNFSEPFTGEYPWPASDDKVYEYGCHEGNYSFGGILRGARVLEKDAMEASSGDDR